MQKKNSSGVVTNIQLENHLHLEIKYLKTVKQEYAKKKKIKQMVREYSKIEYSYCLNQNEDIVEEEQTKLINAVCH
ncbi:hypothetical protein A3Q56_05494 [Intoshia linei]|uniref:Uncharacterized protein n=1 Tax=Intoshia linei TaxID=1819745 RepID=A0A177AXP3_9BILA|nr:hypothetical protein A3Q56_05494 [Intoshia linei]